MPAFTFADCVKAVLKDGYLVPRNVPYVENTSTTPTLRMACGSGALVTGSLVIATGLATIVGFSATLNSVPTGTGTNSNQILVGTFTTGSATVQAYSVNSVTGGTVIATGSAATGAFYWLAFGT